MTHQEAFDKVWAWMSRPNAEKSEILRIEKSLPPRCAYLTSDGNKCAIGCLLSEEAIEEINMENPSVYSIGNNQYRYPTAYKELQDLETSFLNDLQRAHDAPLWGGQWQIDVLKNLIHVAETYGLEVPQ